MPILNLKDKKNKCKVNSKNIHMSFGAIEGTINCYKRKMLTAERALDDIKDYIDEYNSLKENLFNE